MSSDNLIWRHAHGLLTQIAKGLKVLPTLEVTVNAESDPVGNQVGFYLLELSHH